MESVTKQLVKAGHELAVQLSNQLGMIDTASLVQRLTAQLDITAVALREMTRKRDLEHGDVLTWEKTMFKACGEDGHKSVAAKFAELEARYAALAAENAALKNYICDECYVENVRTGHYACAGHGIPSTPATDAFLAEVRAQGVEMYAANLDSGADDAERGGYDDAVKFLRSEASSVRLFAAQLRQDANTAELEADGIITRIEG